MPPPDADADAAHAVGTFQADRFLLSVCLTDAQCRPGYVKVAAAGRLVGGTSDLGDKWPPSVLDGAEQRMGGERGCRA